MIEYDPVRSVVTIRPIRVTRPARGGWAIVVVIIWLALWALARVQGV